MIIKKPYAFLIKHFKLIHLILTVLLTYIVYKSSKIFSFFQFYATKGFYTVTETLTNYVNIYLIVALIISLIIMVFIYLLMRWKKKNRLFYVIDILYSIVLLVIFLFYMNIFNKVGYTVFDVRDIRMYRDIIMIGYFSQYIFLFINLGRALGFNIQKFNFKKDLEELDIAEEDQEEIEVTLGNNDYKYKRVVRKKLRELKYYILENKIYFIIALSVLVLVGAYFIYKNIFSGKGSVNENVFFNINGITFKVNESYVTDIDSKGQTIKDGYYYIVVNTHMENTNTKKVQLDTESIKLQLDNNSYNMSFSNNNYFYDFGNGYNKEYLLSNTEYDYLLIFEIPESITYKSSTLRMIGSLKENNGEVVASYKDVKIKPIDYYKTDESVIYTKGEDISLSDTLLKESSIKVNSYEIGDKFTENFEYCVNSICNNGTKIVKPELLGKDKRTLLKINVEYKLDESIFINKYINNASDLVEYFGIIEYYISGDKYRKSIAVKDLGDITTNNVYLEVPNEIKVSSSISLVITIRNKEIVINL